jgi:uncharacterized protein with PIN domain
VSRATLRFYAELNDFLPPEARGREVEHRFTGHPTVKDAIEGRGVPHSEVHVVVLNGTPVPFDARLSDGDRVSVYPMFTGIPSAPSPAPSTPSLPSLQPAPEPHVRFVADVHLGKLARRLRLLGFDTVWSPDASDPQLVRISVDEGRVLLTRDRGLLKRREVRRGFFVRDDDALEQAIDVVVHLGIGRDIDPFGRCTVCNGRLEQVEKADVEESLPPRTRREFTTFRRCRACGRVYWEGSHHARLARVVDELQARVATART